MAQDLSEMLGQVMENPAFATMVQKLRQEMGDTLDLSALAEKLPAMLSMLSGMGNGITVPEMSDSTTTAGTATVLDTPIHTDTKAADGSGARGKGETFPQELFRPETRDKRNKLLSALKPYLSPSRCAMIDRAMSAMQLGELLGTMGNLPGMPPNTNG